MLNFDFLEKGQGTVSPPYFVYGVSRKLCLMLYSIKFHFPLLLDELGNMCIAIVCFPGFNVISFEINPIFLIKLLLYMTQKSRQKFKYFENKKSF